VAETDRFVLQVCPVAGDEAEELAKQATMLRGELLELDVSRVEPLPAEQVSPGAKGVEALAGWLVLNLGPEALRAVLGKVADWVSRNDREVEVTFGADKLKLSRATREQQEKIIDDWLARHPAVS
jgi:hypothetical protein